MPTVAFITLGCKVNQTETESMAGLFRQRGYELVDAGEKADVYVINTCSVTHLGERKSRQMVRRAGRLNSDAVVAVTGCFAQLSPAETASIEGVDVVVGTQNRLHIVDYVEQVREQKQPILAVSDIMSMREFEEIPLQDSPGRTRAFMKIQDGCDNYCSYCIIPYARGHLRSRSLGGISEETRFLADAGYREIVLTGINLGTYGRETGRHTLVDAVRTVLAEPRIDRVRLSSTESLEISVDLIELMQQEPRLCPHLHLPLQAGDDAILSAMRRPYTTSDYADLLQRLRTRVPDLAVTTDIIVGFPGESADSFARTVEFVSAMQFAKIHVFPYSKRSGTPAASFAGQVGDVEKKRRVAELMRVSEQGSLNFRQRMLGKTLPVLLERVVDGIAEGLTPNYQRVFVDEDIAGLTENQLVQAELVQICEEGLSGRLKK
jgi:threonylcarbamoyladenosine tRNA methylthiotransferase MtaB